MSERVSVLDDLRGKPPRAVSRTINRLLRGDQMLEVSPRQRALLLCIDLIIHDVLYNIGLDHPYKDDEREHLVTLKKEFTTAVQDLVTQLSADTEPGRLLQSLEMLCEVYLAELRRCNNRRSFGR